MMRLYHYRARCGYQWRNYFEPNRIRGSASSKNFFRGRCFPKSARCAPAAWDLIVINWF
jgi:hypothetical protein